MTASLTRPSTTPPGPAGADGGRRPERQATPRASRWAIDLAATIALAAYSFIAALGFGRVFGDWEFVGDSLIIVIVGHGLSLVLRWLRVPGVIAVAVTLLALVWTVGFLHYGSTYTALFPTTGTWDVASADLSLVREQFRFAVAPVEYVGGWALLASVGTAFVVFTSDTFAFRANARGEALVPGAVLFVVVAALGADVSRMGFALALVAAGFLAAVLLRARAAPQARTILGRARNPLSTVLPAAFAAGGLVVLAAWVIGPRLPGANDEPLVDTRNERGGVTEVISPLVDIRSRLVNRSATELFVVNATVPAYWRVTALPEFDGSTWRLPDRNLEDVDGALQPARPGSTENRQEIVIHGPDGSARAGGRRAGRRLRPAAALERRDLDAGQVGRAAGDRRPPRHRVGDAGVHRAGAAGGDVPAAARSDLLGVARQLPVFGRRAGQLVDRRRAESPTTPRSRCRTGSARSSSTASTCPKATGTRPSKPSCASASATASSSPGRSPP